LSIKLGQPSVLGEIIVGVLLGPSLLNILHLPFITNAHLGDTIYELGEIGVLLLMFLAGLELHLSDLTKNTKVAAYSGVLGVLVPVSLGCWPVRSTGWISGPCHVPRLDPWSHQCEYFSSNPDGTQRTAQPGSVLIAWCGGIR